MSPGVARGFVATLRDVERALALPLPRRVRILRELEFDLEEFRNRLVADGLPLEEANARALEALAPDRHALQELDRVHAPLYTRIARRFGGHRVRVAERTALVLATLAVLLLEAAPLVRADLLRAPSPFLWVVLGVGAVLGATIVATAFRMWIKWNREPPVGGLAAVLALSGLVLATGLGGTLVDLYRLASALERAPELAGTLAIRWLVQDSALLAVSMLIALAGGLAWFVSTRWLAVVSGAQREVLGFVGARNRHPDARSAHSDVPAPTKGEIT